MSLCEKENFLTPRFRKLRAYAFDPSLLKAGLNEFVMSGTGNIWIARAEDFAAGSLDRPKHPNRSARSGDDGKTWNRDELGPDGNIDGEYYVRVMLDQARSAGSIRLPEPRLYRHTLPHFP